MTRSRITLTLLLALALLAVASQPLLAQGPSSEWTPAWIDASGDLTEEAVQQVLDQVAASSTQPEHVVFLIHGWATPRARSTDQYNDLAPRLQAAFQRLGKRAAIIGVQWDSASHGGLLGLLSDYKQKIPLARKTGHLGVRRLMLAVRERFPSAHLSVLGHSMGCEVAAAAAVPTSAPDRGQEQAEAWRPDQPLDFNVVVLAGSDLDYDAAFKSGVQLNFARTNLVWMTTSRLYRRSRDKVLDLRALVRGKAMGSTLPRMTADQYRALLSGRKAVFDNERIPPTHSFLMYYDDARLARVVGAMACKADPSGVPLTEDLADIDRVMQAPYTAEGLLPWLNSRRLSTMIYAVWRLENLLGDGEKHLEDEYLTHLADEATDRPRAVRTDRGDSPCATVRAGYWPTATQLARAGAPSWADPTGSSWQKDFRGEVVGLDGRTIEVLTEYGDYFVFDILENQTLCTPGLEALRVGVAVQVRADFDHAALVIRVIPLPRWLEMQSEDQR